MALAAIYLRLSKDEENQGIEQVLDNHRRKLVKLAEKNNLHFELYQEIQSGVNTDRVQFNLLLSRIDEYDYLLVHDLDRITRDNIHAEQIKLILMENNIKILTPSGTIDLANEMNDMMFSFQAMMGNYEWKQIRKRLARGRMATAEKGYWVHTSKIPLGYSKTIEKKLEINEEEAEIIRYIFQQTLEGVTANGIARNIFALGWRARSGKVLTTSHINSIRKNATYYGCIQVKPKKTKRIVEEVFVENAHPAIISKEMFLNVQNYLKRNKGEKFRERGEITRALQGTIYCARCGRKRYIQKDGNGTDYIKSCNYKVMNNPCEDSGYQYWKVEEKVFAELKKYKEKLTLELEKLQSNDLEDVKKQVMKELQNIEYQKNKQLIKRKNLTNLRLENEISKQEFEEYRDDIDKIVIEIDSQIVLLKVKLSNLETNDYEQNKLQQIVETLEKLETLEPLQVNHFIRQFIKKIYFATNENSTGNHKTHKRTYKDVQIEIEPY